jgi:hypothetical protein
LTSAGAFLTRLVEALRSADIPFMVAGSFASTYHGVPRTTHDIDLVVDPNFKSLRAFLADLGEDDYYVDAATAEGALRTRGQFNVIDLETGWKVDLIIRKSRVFSVEEFSRREKAEMLGVSVFVATAEDTILSKLEWERHLGRSARCGTLRGYWRLGVQGSISLTSNVGRESWAWKIGGWRRRGSSSAGPSRGREGVSALRDHGSRSQRSRDRTSRNLGSSASPPCSENHWAFDAM